MKEKGHSRGSSESKSLTADILRRFRRNKTAMAALILLLLIIGSLIMLSLGIIGIYIAKIYEEVKGRPRYFIARKISGKKKDN